MKTISLVMPVYNEAEGIEIFHKELSHILDNLKDKYIFRIIYVVDKCSDRSYEIIKAIADRCTNVKVLLLTKRFGHQMSLVAGMDKCSGDAVIMMDCDLQHPVNLIPEMLAYYEQGFDIVHTCRVRTEGISLFKKYSSILFYKLINTISDTNINDNFSDYRLISANVLQIFQNNIREQNQFLRGLFSWVGFKSAVVEYEALQRRSGKSKYDIFRLLSFSLSGILSFSKAPLRASILLGIIISSLSFVYGIYSTTAYIINKNLPSGWTSLIVCISFLGGAQLMFLGIIGEYIARIYEEVKNRPLYIVEDEYNGCNDDR
ncbi:MAG: glycosyltransferase family 2 protein [Candidatus Magnetominusculus sp. LBB02]|nr:glycosyltransferase family 2 protein [Candidatus Magnetominusculus sp. LBB02]